VKRAMYGTSMDVPNVSNSMVRYWDDILLYMTGTTLEEEKVQEIKTYLKHIYGETLKVALEQWSHKHPTFLDYHFNLGPHKINIWHYNQRYDQANSNTLQFMGKHVSVSQRYEDGVFKNENR
jgi:hypothetical protein